jgi:hypothetical protein
MGLALPVFGRPQESTWDVDREATVYCTAECFLVTVDIGMKLITTCETRRHEWKRFGRTSLRSQVKGPYMRQISSPLLF